MAIVPQTSATPGRQQVAAADPALVVPDQLARYTPEPPDQHHDPNNQSGVCRAYTIVARLNRGKRCDDHQPRKQHSRAVLERNPPGGNQKSH